MTGVASLPLGRKWVEDDVQEGKVVGVRYGYHPGGYTATDDRDYPEGLTELVEGAKSAVEERTTAIEVESDEPKSTDLTESEQHVIDAVAYLREKGKKPTNPKVASHMRQKGISHMYDLESRSYSEDWIGRTRSKLRKRDIDV